ncbi:hypothetical protein [Nitratireductor sp. CH_MIT9313-5]|mgnify:CR=1 FL=1|uniref:hypothetical protein n=1 Tax=Nitratireductor sp. CH_MIT9313-5 TaxID=3107764 RepID=UPI0026D37519
MTALTYTPITRAALLAVDGDTMKCDGQNMRLLGLGAPNVEGIDTPETMQSARRSC